MTDQTPHDDRTEYETAHGLPSQGEFNRRLDENLAKAGDAFGEHMREQAASPDPVGHAVTALHKRKRLSSKTARASRVQRAATFEFELTNTLDEDGNPTTALARKPALLEADEMRHLPDHMQESIFKLMEETEAFEGDIDAAETEVKVATLARSYGSIMDMANGYVLRGFIDPKVYPTPEEADANDGVWLQDIDIADRMAFFDRCTGASREAAKVAAPFRGPVDAVDARPDGAAVSGDGQPESHPAPAATPDGAGVLRV